ncbi:Peptide-N(4)-(N-acetyl-beta-glucosaminyl)asparagine amidase [Nymphon striatum]|nr:Peptide-N(4)-(N-acetyl-beta-glucosaminyl)asparagine amidase [Nymphon striatum]
MSSNAENVTTDVSSSVAVLFSDINRQNINANDEVNAKILDAVKLLLKIAANIINNPSNEKYRQIRLSNTSVSNRLLPVHGAMECLFEMGFEENDEHLVFPKSTSVEQLKCVVNEINKHILNLKQSDSNNTPIAESNNEEEKSSDNSKNTPKAESNTQKEKRSIKIQVYNLLKRNLEHVKMYENTSLQDKARALIPSDCLKHCDTKDGDFDKVLLNLLSWFKNKFFTWTDKPKCHICAAMTQSVGGGHPNQDDIKWMTSVVEIYRCTKCPAITRFPRYNHPEKLLETRTGRCGEYANCFTLMCRASGFEARYVYDYTDHVWTEVFSDKQQRWLHCDPCEDKCDVPLMYEQGWKKNLTYVFAFSAIDVMDVTWRYTKDHKQVLKRRNLCDENSLVQTIANTNKQLQNDLSQEVKKKLQFRLVKEIVEFMTPVNTSAGEYGGRMSGSLGWRMSRGEVDRPKIKSNYKFKLTDKEKVNKKFHLQYCCSSDEYIRISNDHEKIQGFQSCLMWQKAILRKVEHDWKMSYLAREPSSSHAMICWSFDFSDCDLIVNKMLLNVPGTVFENGVINIKLVVGENSISVDFGKKNIFTEELKDKNMFMLVAELRGGKGENAWQHTQLFRQALDSLQNTLEIEIDFLPVNY